MLKKLYLSLTICFRSILRIKGDNIDGIYYNKDSQDETELVSFLGNSIFSDENIIHPYQEDAHVIFYPGNKGNKGNKSYKYNKLANSPTDFLTSNNLINCDNDCDNDSDSDSDCENINKKVINDVTVTKIDEFEIFHDSLDS